MGDLFKMATKIYLRRGTRTEILGIIPEEGEPVWANDTKALYIGDDTTSGGIFVGGTGIGVDTLNALVGAITVSGGTGIVVTVSGQYIIIDEEAGGLDVDSLNALTGVVTISGQGNNTVIVDGQAIVISGTDIGTYVDSLNALTGEVSIVGAGVVTVSEAGQVITVSGSSSGGSESFVDLTDTPANYDDAARKIAAVNAGQTGVEFVKAINVESALTSDEDYSGLTCSGIAGETLGFGESVYYKNDGKWWRTIATVEEQVYGHVTLVVTSGIADASMTLLTVGFIRDDSWGWSTSSNLWLATTSGDLTEAIPTGSGEFVVKMGCAHASNIVWFNPDSTVIELE